MDRKTISLVLFFTLPEVSDLTLLTEQLNYPVVQPQALGTKSSLTKVLLNSGLPLKQMLLCLRKAKSKIKQLKTFEPARTGRNIISISPQADGSAYSSY